MLVYTIIILLLISLTLIYDIKKINYGRIQCEWLVLLLLVLVAGLRNHVGGDSIRTEYTFYHVVKELSELFNDDQGKSQPLWWILMSTCKTFFGSFVVFQFVHAIILNSLIFRFVKKTTPYFFAAMLFCFCVTWLNLSFEVMREALCVGIYLNALLLLKKKKYVKYFLLGAIMMGIHWFSFVIVLATPIVVLFNSKLLYSFVITMSVLILTYVNADTFYVLDLLASDSLSADASERISVYINQNEDNLYNVNGLIRLLSVSVLLPVITAYHCNKKNNGDDKLFVKLLALFVFFGVLQTKLVLFARFLNYFYLILIILLVNVLLDKKIRVPVFRYFYNFLIVCLLIDRFMFFYLPKPTEMRTNIHYNCDMIPYTSIFEDRDVIREEKENEAL